MIRALAAWIATALTRFALGFYPASFRREMGAQIVEDVRRRAGELDGALAPVKMIAWLVRLGGSLAFNALGAWREGGAAPARDRIVGEGGAFSWLDVKLGLRMLVKSPLLTLTGCAAIATAIAINAGFTEFMGDFFGRFETPEVGGRLVALTNQDLESGGREGRLLEDLGRWRSELETVERIGAVTTLDLNLVSPDGRSVPVGAAEVSASVFEVTGTGPVLGRVLVDSDDGPAAEPVVVLGSGVWRTLGGDPGVIGTTVRLGEVVHTVVGVAPEDFTFPVGREHVWVNFRHDPGAFAPRTGPSVIAFGRLVPGRSLAEARAEIAQLGTRASSDHPETHAQIRPTVIPFEEMVGLAGSPLAVWALRGARTFFVLLLIAACANVATLVFARNAGREREIAIRNALGAGRGRIVMQLFAEAMVLALLSAAVGLLVADVGLRHGSQLFWEAQYTEPPAWFDPGLSLATALYSLGLAVLGAGVVGILPGLRATRGGSAAMLQRAGSGGGTLSFGWLPTGVIVVQTAITVALLPVVLTGTVADYTDQRVEASFPTEPYLSARLMVDSEVRRVTEAEDAAAGGEPIFVDVFGVSGNYRITRTLLERYDAMADDISRRLATAPGVRRAVVTSRLPGVVGGTSMPGIRLELGGEANPDRGTAVRFTEADLGLFDVIGRSVLAGRAFTAADYGEDQRVALVNTSFVTELFGGRSPVGRLVREVRRDADPDAPWTQIVGVIPDDVAGPGGVTPHIYLPRTGPGRYPLKLLVQVDGDAAAFGPRLRALVADAQPGMLLDEVIPLAEMRRSEELSQLFGVAVMLFVALVTMLLSTTGVYALMSFIVAQRTREIGIRTALGADAPLVVRGVFRRALVQLSLGVVAGLGIVWLALRESVAEGSTRDLLLSGVGVATVLVVVGMIGCAVPLARALRVQPMRALATE